jgi:hypothetical protein
VYKSKRSVDVDQVVLDINAIKKAIDFNPKDINEGIKKFIKIVI